MARSKTKKAKPSAEVSEQETIERENLKTWGWYPAQGGWRHRRLEFPWSQADAWRLTKEMLDGGQDLIHRAMRGEQ